MSEVLGQSLTAEEDDAVQAELAAMEESSLRQELEDLPEVPKVWLRQHVHNCLRCLICTSVFACPVQSVIAVPGSSGCAWHDKMKSCCCLLCWHAFELGLVYMH